MMNYEEIASAIEGYKEYFLEHFNDEKYKWEAVKHFQDNWDIEAENFAEMLSAALSKTFNLLNSVNHFPGRMITIFAQEESETTRAMFRHLFDESIDLEERIKEFKKQSDECLIKWQQKNGKKDRSHFQDENSISVYLWLRFPDKYYIYKYSEIKKVSETFLSYHKIKKGYAEKNVIEAYTMYDEIRSVLMDDDTLIQMLHSYLDDSCYSDDELRTFTMDFGFYVSRFYKDEKETAQQSPESKPEQSTNNDEESDVINTWLLAWNPKNYDWENVEKPYDYNTVISNTKKQGAYSDTWRCVSKNIKTGDRIFIIRLGQNPKGIIATGYAVSDSYIDEYDDGIISNNNLRIVDICITGFLDYHTEPLISQDLLKEKFPEQQWSPQGSGISIKPDAAKWLIEEWNRIQYGQSNHIEDTATDDRKPAIWKISHGKNGNGVAEWFKDDFERRRIVVVNGLTTALIAQKIPQGKLFTQEIKKGDFFYLCYGGQIILLGQILDDEVVPNIEMNDLYIENGHPESADWYQRKYSTIAISEVSTPYIGKKKQWTSNFNSTCVKIKENELSLFEEWILKPYFNLTLNDLKNEKLPPETDDTYTKEDFLSDVFMSEKEYDKLTALLKRKKNIILQGAPGVGKTYCAKRLAWSLMGEKDIDRVCMVQFHQSYSYEDFIMGYRPDDEGGFVLQEGVFYRFCEEAKNEPDNDYYFIIDEINRGNLSKIFGELLMLIESDKRCEDHQIELIYGNEPFYIPENLHIIGMMNTADRSLAMIDYALRRRFSFYTMHPAFEKADENGFADYANEIDCPLYHSVIDRIKEVNKAIKNDSTLDSGFEIGHSYFTSEDISIINDEWVKNVVEYEIIPLIEEYWFDNEAEAPPSPQT